MDITELEPLILAVYDAAMYPVRWHTFLASVCSALACTAMTIIALDETGERRTRMAIWHGISDDAMRDYQSGLEQLDPLMGYAYEHPDQRLVFEHHHTPPDAITTSPFHQIMEQRTGLRYRVSARLFTGDNITAYTTLHRTRPQGDLDAETVAAFTHLLPHIERAVRIAIRLGNLEMRSEAMTDAIKDLPTAVMLLDDRGRLLYANASADRILNAQDALTVGTLGLTALRKSDNARLREALQSACDPDRPWARTLSVPRKTGAPAYVVRAVPLSNASNVFATLRPACAVFISDPARQTCANPASLQTVFGLTAKQAALAASLAEGHSLKESAHQMGIAEKTARSHLEAIFRKTATSRQSELLRLILAATSPIG